MKKARPLELPDPFQNFLFAGAEFGKTPRRLAMAGRFVMFTGGISICEAYSQFWYLNDSVRNMVFEYMLFVNRRPFRIICEFIVAYHIGAIMAVSHVEEDFIGLNIWGRYMHLYVAA